MSPSHERSFPNVQVYHEDKPSSPLPAFDFDSNEAIGKLIIIPASKYPAFVPKKDGVVHPSFVGWAGKIMAFENNRRKLKVKIHGDAGYEHLDIKGKKYAVSTLERLA